MSQVVDRSREVLAVLFPSEAGEVRLLSGDMVTSAAFGVCMGKTDDRFEAMSQGMALLTAQLAGIEGVPERWLVVGCMLVALLIVAQVGTPFLVAALIHR